MFQGIASSYATEPEPYVNDIPVAQEDIDGGSKNDPADPPAGPDIPDTEEGSAGEDSEAPVANAVADDVAKSDPAGAATEAAKAKSASTGFKALGTEEAEEAEPQPEGSKIQNMVGVLGLGVGKGTTLVNAFDAGRETQTAWINPKQTEAVFDVTVEKGTALYLGAKGEDGVLLSTEGNRRTETDASITYRIGVDCTDITAKPALYAYGDGGEEASICVLAFSQRSPVAGVYTPDRAVDFQPTTTDRYVAVSRAESALTAYTHWNHYVSLGGHGGYATYYYEEPIEDDPNNPYGVDFIVYGNAFAGGSVNEPAGCQVSYDGVTWYDLAGMRHYELLTRYVQDLPLLNGGTTDSLLLLKAGDAGYSGSYPKNVDWGYADIMSCNPYSAAETRWDVQAHTGNPYKHAVSKVDDEYYGYGDQFDLAWAVDKAGRPIDLSNALPKGVRYIRLQNVIDSEYIGAVSPEIGTITRVNPVDVKDSPVGVTDAPSVLTVNGKPLDLESETTVVSNDGATIYCEADLGKETYAANVCVVGAASDSIYVNAEEFTNGLADYRGELSQEDTWLNEENGRIVRVVVQNGEKAPRIYVINCKNGLASKANAELASVELRPIGKKLKADGDGGYATTVASDIDKVSFVLKSLYSGSTIKVDDTDVPNGLESVAFPLKFGKNEFTVKVTSEDETTAKEYSIAVTRTEVDDRITVYMDFEGYNLGQGYYIEPTAVKISEGMNAAYATDRLLGLTGHEYDNTGTVSEDFYLSKVKGFDTGDADPPQYVLDAIDVAGETFGTNGDEWLGEHDYYNQAGWMLTVNNVVIPGGASGYTLKDGDVVRWQFSVIGLGADLGVDNGWGEGDPPLYIQQDKTKLIRAMFEKDAEAEYVQNAEDAVIDPFATKAAITSAYGDLHWWVAENPNDGLFTQAEALLKEYYGTEAAPEAADYAIMKKLKITGTMTGSGYSDYYYLHTHANFTNVRELDLTGVTAITGSPSTSLSKDGALSLQRVRISPTTPISYLFKYMPSLTTLVVGDGPYTPGVIDLSGYEGTTFGTYAFQYSTGITAVRLPADKAVSNYMFRGCTGLTTVSIGGNTSAEGVIDLTGYTPTTIGTYAFQGTGATSAVLPEKLSVST
jgi:hypothetical protein